MLKVYFWSSHELKGEGRLLFSGELRMCPDSKIKDFNNQVSSFLAVSVKKIPNRLADAEALKLAIWTLIDKLLSRESSHHYMPSLFTQISLKPLCIPLLRQLTSNSDTVYNEPSEQAKSSALRRRWCLCMGTRMLHFQSELISTGIVSLSGHH